MRNVALHRSAESRCPIRRFVMRTQETRKQGCGTTDCLEGLCCDLIRGQSAPAASCGTPQTCGGSARLIAARVSSAPAASCNSSTCGAGPHNTEAPPPGPAGTPLVLLGPGGDFTRDYTPEPVRPSWALLWILGGALMFFALMMGGCLCLLRPE